MHDNFYTWSFEKIEWRGAYSEILNDANIVRHNCLHQCFQPVRRYALVPMRKPCRANDKHAAGKTKIAKEILASERLRKESAWGTFNNMFFLRKHFI